MSEGKEPGDSYVPLAQSLGLKPHDFNTNRHDEYWFNVAGGVHWNRLRVIN